MYWYFPYRRTGYQPVRIWYKQASKKKPGYFISNRL